MSRVSLEARGRRPAPPRPQVSPVRARPSGSLSKSHWPPEGLLHTGPTAEPPPPASLGLCPVGELQSPGLECHLPGAAPADLNHVQASDHSCQLRAVRHCAAGGTETRTSHSESAQLKGRSLKHTQGHVPSKRGRKCDHVAF